MFALHEKTQRRVCRVSFLTVCVVPTLVSLAALAYCNRPWRETDWQRWLTQRLHVRAQVAEVAWPTPGETVLTDLQLADLRSRQHLGTIDLLRYETESSQQMAVAKHVQLHGDQLPALAAAIGTWISTGELPAAKLQIEKLTVTDSRLHVAKFRNLKLSCDAAASQFRLQLQDAAGQELLLALEDRGSSHRLVLNTQEGRLPAWLLAAFVPGLQGCGEASFQGVVSAELATQSVSGKLQGKLTAIDLASWLGDSGPHRLRGSANADLKLLQWTGQRIETAQGSVRGDAGGCSYSLLHNAKAVLRCQAGEAMQTLQVSSPSEWIPFDELGLDFHMTTNGFAFTGLGSNRSLLSRKQSPLLIAPQATSLFSVGQLVQLFDHLSQPGWLPATRDAHDMADQLPLPEKVSRQPQAQQK